MRSLLLCFRLRLKSAGDRPHSTSIHILDDDSLLNIFYLYRPVLLTEEEDIGTWFEEEEEWVQERWWYKLAQVCRRWRYLILQSVSHLDICLLCTYGTPVTDMLAHSPPLPLIIDYLDKGPDITAKEEDILLALQHRDRVRRISLRMPVATLRRLVIAIDEEFPMLDYLYIGDLTNDNTGLMLPETFQAPQLRHLLLEGVACPMGSPLITTAAGLMSLLLGPIPSSAYFSPNDLLLGLALLPKLMILGINFLSPTPADDVERQLLHTPIMTHATLPELRYLGFKGVSAYLEALLSHITAPPLERFHIGFVSQPTNSLPHLQQFTNTTKKQRWNSARLGFNESLVFLGMFPREWGGLEPWFMAVHCRHLDLQVASLAQISNALRAVVSAVEYLTLEYSRSPIWSEWPDGPDRAQWRELLRPFSNVKTLSVPEDLIWELSFSLQSDDGESPMELLPELKELSYPASDDSDVGDAFAAFADARHNAGHPFALVRR